MPRKKAKLDQTDSSTESPILSEEQIKQEPLDDYEDPSTHGNGNLGDIQIKSEPEEYEYVLNGFEETSSDLNHNQYEEYATGSLNSVGENHSNGSEMAEMLERGEGSEADSMSGSGDLTTHETSASPQDKTYRNVSITKEEYEKYTGKELIGPITKKMYEHFRYMKTKILYKDKFQCELCTRTFPFRHELARHRLYHTGIKQHECEICGKSFILKGQLTTHMLSHTRIRRFKCKYCPATFLLGSHLRQHLPSHDPNLRLRCEHCNLTFTRKASLDRHVKRIHIEKEKIVTQLPDTAQRKHGTFTICQQCNQVIRSDRLGCACSRKDYCVICDSRLGNAKNLALHMETFHSNSNQVSDDSVQSHFRIANGKLKLLNQNGEQSSQITAANQNTEPSSAVDPPFLLDTSSKRPPPKTVRARQRKPYFSTQIKLNADKSKKRKPDTGNSHILPKTNGPVFNIAGSTPQPVHFIVNNTLATGGVAKMPQNGITGGINFSNLGNQYFLVPVNVVGGKDSTPTLNNKAEVNNANGYHNVVFIEPKESESRKKEEIDRVVTFKVELPNNEDVMAAVTSGIKIEPEETERQENESDRFVVYKVKEEDTSIQEGFYKALCIKQEKMDVSESESQSLQLSAANQSINSPQEDVHKALATTHSTNETIAPPNMHMQTNSEVSQNSTPIMSSSSNHATLHPIECTLTEVSMEEGTRKSTKIVRPSKSKSAKVTLDSLFSNAIESNISST